MDRIRKWSYGSFFKNNRFKHIAFHYSELPYPVFKDDFDRSCILRHFCARKALVSPVGIQIDWFYNEKSMNWSNIKCTLE